VGRDGQIVEQIQQMWIDRMYVAGPEIAKEMVDLRQGIRHVRAAAEVLYGEAAHRLWFGRTPAGGFQTLVRAAARGCDDGANPSESGHEGASRRWIMDEAIIQDAVIAFLSAPAAYGPTAGAVERIDTHNQRGLARGAARYKLKARCASTTWTSPTMELGTWVVRRKFD